jgi:hypothetical protein
MQYPYPSPSTINIIPKLAVLNATWDRAWVGLKLVSGGRVVLGEILQQTLAVVGDGVVEGVGLGTGHDWGVGSLPVNFVEQRFGHAGNHIS